MATVSLKYKKAPSEIRKLKFFDVARMYAYTRHQIESIENSNED